MDRAQGARRRRHGWLWLVPLVALAACGCQTVRTPEERIANSNIPKEMNKVSMPEYVVEPPDILLVEVLEALPGRPITGERLVRPDGTISLDFYGQVYVAGLTLPEIKEKIVIHLRNYLSDEVLGLYRPSNTKDEWEPVPPRESDRVFVDVASYNSKFYYVTGDLNGAPLKLPITGGETVLDAIVNTGGLSPTASVPNIRLVRPAPPGACCEQLLPVNYEAIVHGGDPTTNYQLMPGDRIVVYRDPIVRTTLFLDRLAAPFNTVIQTMLTYAFSVRSIHSINVPIGGSANNNVNVNTGGNTSTTPTLAQ